MTDTETVTVEYEVVEMERFDRGPIMAVATVGLSIAGVEVLLRGVTMRRADAGYADVQPPQFRDPGTGRWCPSVVLPKKVWDAIAVEIGGVVAGRTARLVA